VDRDGHVLGVVFATSASQPDQAYALTDDQIAADIQKGNQSSTTINTAQYACAA
jgi:hypothetical protein